MRIRATVAVASGALALSAFAVPASQAAQSHHDRPVAQAWGSAVSAMKGQAPAAGKRSALAAVADPVITKTVVNNGVPITVGTKEAKKVTVAVTASAPSGISDALVILWRGSGSVFTENADNAFLQNEDAAKCKAASATTSTCTVTVTVDPMQLWNVDAATWHVGAIVLANDFSYVEKDASSTVKFQRFSRMTNNATPEPVKKGKTITVTGLLTRANWDLGVYKPYTGQSVVFQSHKKTTTTYGNVRTVKTTSTGTLKTTVTASVDSYYRYNFAGTSTTPAVKAAGDFVDVK